MRILVAFLALIPAGAFAQAADAGAATGSQQMAGILPLVAIAGVMYFLLIRPQQKRLKQHQAVLSTLKKGDMVITGGGIIGKITKVDDTDQVSVEIAKGVEVVVLKGTINNVLNADAPKVAVPAAKKKTAEKNDNVVPSKDQIANDN